MSDAITLFRELIAADPASARAAVPAMRARLRELRCAFGDRDLVKVLRPKFLEVSDYARLGYVSSVVVGACRRLADRAVSDPALRAFLGISEAEFRLMGPEPLCPDPVAFSRLDSFATAAGPRFVELNAEAPAGAGYADRCLEGLRTHPVVRAFEARSGATAIPTREGVLGGLLTAWRAAGRGGRPRILVTDYLDLPTRNEFHILLEFFEAQGYRSVLEDPRALDYRGGVLYAGGEKVDLVYRRVLVNEFLDREPEVRGLSDAVRDGAVVMINPWRSKAVHKKASFAVLTGDFVGREWMTSEERRVIDEVVPWTRRVRAATTEKDGRRVDLLPFLSANRDRFVLKPNDEYGGKGVVLGWETPSAEFDAALRTAAAGEWVAQERVEPLTEPFPLLDQDLAEQPMIVDLDPYLYFGRVHGVLARLAAGSLCNVTSGGGQTPVMLVPDP